jgi:NAD+ synthase
MTDSLAIALAQINPNVGAIAANVERIRAERARAAAEGAELVVFTELSVCGYPPEDLVQKRAFVEDVRAAVEDLAGDTADGGPGMIVGAPWDEGDAVYNAAILLEAGEIAAVVKKYHLPNYGVFDEVRVFARGPMPGPVNFRGVRLGIMVCEDMWYDDVAETLAETGAEILLVPNGSPFEVDKDETRTQLAVARVMETGLPLAYVNQVGGQDELVFDGGSFVIGRDRRLKVNLAQFGEETVVTRWTRGAEGWDCAAAAIRPDLDDHQGMYRAMMLGLHDYVEKNGFPGVVIGLSGGIDSALTAAVAVDALGPERVHCVMMPSKYTSEESLEDAAEAARLLGVKLDSIPIVPGVEAFDAMLGGLFADTRPDTTEENIQARLRGILLMAISNKFGWMVVSTGNKSEMSVGYATLYGDMCGGYSVLKDAYKTTVFALSKWRNEGWPSGGLGPEGPVMPERIITKPPSAELRADQKDADSLPPYDQLDAILYGLIENDLGERDLVAQGHDAALVRRVWRMLEGAEYKRRQAPPGVKLSKRALSRDRRYPIVNAYRGRA